MNPCGSSLSGGILYSAPFACWFFAVVDGAQTGVEVGAVVANAFRTLILVQGFAAAFLYPSLGRGDIKQDLSAVIALFAVPWPLLVVFSLAGNVETWLLGLSQLVLVMGTMALMALAGAGRRVARPTLRPYAAAAVHITGFAVVLAAAGPWLKWTV